VSQASIVTVFRAASLDAFLRGARCVEIRPCSAKPVIEAAAIAVIDRTLSSRLGRSTGGIMSVGTQPGRAAGSAGPRLLAAELLKRQPNRRRWARTRWLRRT